MDRNLIGRYYYYPPEKKLEEAVTSAVRSYMDKLKRAPELVLVHPKNFTLDLVTVDGYHIPIKSDKSIYAPTIYFVCEAL